MGSLGADGFCTVHGRTAAEGDDGLAVVLAEQAEAFFYIIGGGVCAQITEAGIPDSCFVHGLQHTIGQAQLHQFPVRDHQNIVRAFFPQEGRKSADTSGTVNILRKTIGNGIVCDFENCLKDSASQDFECVGN